MKHLIIIFAAFLFASCELIDREIDPEIEPYVNEFYYQAERRGLNLEKPNMKIIFKDISSQGRCNMVFKTILIDKNSYGWKHNPEALVFHELGHLILKRDHKNDVVNKYCLSIMSEIDDPIYDTHYGDKLYERREYYLDELFGKVSSTPEWITLRK